MDISESTIGSVLSGAIRQWAVSFPIIAVWIVGLLLAFARWRRSPKVSLLVILACGLSLLMTLVMPVVQQLAITTFGRSGSGSISAILMAVSLIWTCLAAVSSGLLIFAAFADRPDVGS
jgi:hypothetical protein